MPAIPARFQAENERLTGEMTRRIGIVSGEVDSWTKQADANAEGFGIHKSQLRALRELMIEIVARQEPRLAEMKSAQSQEAFAKAYLKAVDDVVGGQDIWRIFRASMGDRGDPTLKSLLDAADLVAASAYQFVMERAKSNGIVQEDQFRAPPLVCLNAADSPAAAIQRETLGRQLDVRRYRDMLLPLPIVLLPADQLACVWLLCSIHHEVGHAVDKDLGLEAALKSLILGAPLPQDRMGNWWKWTSEMVADALALQLGGAGFAQAISAWLLLLAGSGRLQDIDAAAKHPNPNVRIPLLCTMLRAQAIAESSLAASEIEETFNLLPVPSWAPAYVSDVKTIVKILLDTPLPVLKDKPLREMAPFQASDAGQVAVLGEYILKKGKLPASAPLATTFRGRHHLVPIAAQLALGSAADASPTTLDRIQKNALEYMALIERPAFLAVVPDAAKQARYRDLARALDFGAR